MDVHSVFRDILKLRNPRLIGRNRRDTLAKAHTLARVQREASDQTPAKPPGFPPCFQAACSISASSVSLSSVLPRRGPFCSCVSITFNDSVSVNFCTTRISRAMRSSAVS
jgi:hypothetical protein